jgi:hypothetical protein
MFVALIPFSECFAPLALFNADSVSRETLSHLISSPGMLRASQHVQQRRCPIVEHGPKVVKSVAYGGRSVTSDRAVADAARTRIVTALVILNKMD